MPALDILAYRFKREERKLAKYERAVVAASVVANCSSGVIGKTTPDGK